jgi:hypothetical protein
MRASFRNLIGSFSEVMAEIFDRTLLLSVLLIIMFWAIIMFSLPYLPYPT